MTSHQKRCPNHGGEVIRLLWDVYFCIPEKGWYTGTTGHEFN